MKLLLIYLLSQQYASSGELWTILIVIGLVVVFLIIYATNESSKEQNELDEWVSNNEELLGKQNVVIDVMNQFATQTPACEKCNSINFQIWELNNIEFKFRCLNCKKIIKADINAGLQDMIDLINSYFELYKVFSETQNSKKREYLHDFFYYDFTSLRKGQKLIRAIHFNGSYDAKVKYSEDKKSNKSRRIPQDVKDKVWNRDDGKCVQCGSNENLEFDHIIPFSKGGANTYRNIQLLCEPCNRSKSDSIG